MIIKSSESQLNRALIRLYQFRNNIDKKDIKLINLKKDLRKYLNVKEFKDGYYYWELNIGNNSAFNKSLGQSLKDYKRSNIKEYNNIYTDILKNLINKSYNRILYCNLFKYIIKELNIKFNSLDLDDIREINKSINSLFIKIQSSEIEELDIDCIQYEYKQSVYKANALYLKR